MRRAHAPVRLSDTFAKRAEYRGAGACIYWDQALPGYGLRVYPSGARSWVVLFRIAKPGEKQQLRVLELFQRCPEDLARRKASRALRLAGEGVDPFEEAAPPPPRRTVWDLHDEYLRLYVLPKNKPKTVDEVRRSWKLHLLPALGELAIVDVTPARLLDLKAKLVGSPYAFNRAMSYFHTALEQADQVLRWIPRAEHPDWQNPAGEKLVPRYPEAKRKRRFRRHEAAAFAAALERALDDSPGYAELALALIWLSASRPNEILGARWEWVEWCAPAGNIIPSPPETALLRLPEAKGDRGDAEGRIIGFGPRGTAVLRRLQAFRVVGNPYVVPTTRRAGDHLRIPYGTWRRLMAEAGIEKPWPTPYAMRHAFRTLGQGVIAPEAMQEQLGHATLAMGEHYRDRLDELQVEALRRMEGVMLPEAKETEHVH